MGSKHSKTSSASISPKPDDGSIYNNSRKGFEDDTNRSSKPSPERRRTKKKRREEDTSTEQPNDKQETQELSQNSNASNRDNYCQYFTSEDGIDVRNYVYPFENIVLEGGGNKGIAYCGTLKILAEVGILENIHRYAGASAGALTAALLAVGYDPDDIRRYLDQDLSKLFLDHGCGYCSLLPNLIKHYGWNPGRRLLHYLGVQLEEATGNANITFKEVYEKYGNELCVVVTNLNRMDTEYCHVKTTPDMPIKLAVRMSTSIPALFQGVRYKRGNSMDLYVDGGLLCNYPIHCFDGWWLSMKPENNYFRKFQALSDIGRLWDKKERFGEYNKSTIGLLLFAGDECEVMKSLLRQRDGVSAFVPQRPQTKLTRQRRKEKEQKNEAERKHNKHLQSMTKFLQVLSDNNLDQNSTISKEEFYSAISNKSIFTEDNFTDLFGPVSVDEVFNVLDVTADGKIHFSELVLFAEKKGIDIQSQFIGYDRREIKNFAKFLDALQESLLLNVKRLYFDETDVDRTIGIDTDYVRTEDFKLERADKDFLFEQGARSAACYLKHYVKKYEPPLKEQ